MAEKIDFKREHLGYQASHGSFDVVEIQPTRYFAVDGHGDPNTSPEFARAIGALYPAAYALKFLSKRELGRDYVVPPLEGLWWSEDQAAFLEGRKADWSWTLLLMIPDWLSSEAVDRARDAGTEKAGPDAPELRVFELAEGRCVQTLHIGSFDGEGPVLARMHDEFIPSQGLVMAGTHHEIYLSDFRRVAPERQRTILRQPVEQR